MTTVDTNGDGGGRHDCRRRRGRQGTETTAERDKTDEEGSVKATDTTTVDRNGDTHGRHEGRRRRRRKRAEATADGEETEDIGSNIGGRDEKERRK